MLVAAWPASDKTRISGTARGASLETRQGTGPFGGRPLPWRNWMHNTPNYLSGRSTVNDFCILVQRRAHLALETQMHPCMYQLVGVHTDVTAKKMRGYWGTQGPRNQTCCVVLQRRDEHLLKMALAVVGAFDVDHYDICPSWDRHRCLLHRGAIAEAGTTMCWECNSLV